MPLFFSSTVHLRLMSRVRTDAGDREEGEEAVVVGVAVGGVVGVEGGVAGVGAVTGTSVRAVVLVVADIVRTEVPHPHETCRIPRRLVSPGRPQVRGPGGVGGPQPPRKAEEGPLSPRGTTGGDSEATRREEEV